MNLRNKSPIIRSFDGSTIVSRLLIAMGIVVGAALSASAMIARYLQGG